jgi:hypothetical protein
VSEVILSEAGLSEVGLPEIVMPVVILSEVGLPEIVMSVVILSEVVMLEIGLSEVVMPVLVVMPGLVDAPVTPVQHLVAPGRLRAIQAAVGLHPGRGGVNVPLLIIQAVKFPGSKLSRLHTLVHAMLLSHFPLAEVGAVGFGPGGEARQDDPARQQAGHDAFSPDFHWFILRI